VSSILSTASLLSVAMCISGFKISTSASALISPAVTMPSPAASIYTVFAFSACSFATMPLILRIISVTSSLTPVTVENSCRISSLPDIFTDVTAVPGSDESKILRSELPSVVP